MKKIVYELLLIAVVFCLNINVYAEKKEVELKKCVDGDTARFVLDGEEIKARFLAIDTPESVHPTIGEEPYGKEASQYTCNLLTNAKEIILEYDSKSDKTDKYDRHLVWVFVDDVLLQEDLISKGYAQLAYLYGDYKYIEELESVQEKSKKKKIGIWSDEETTKTITEENDDNENDEEIVVKKSDIKSILNSIYEILKKLIEIIETITNDVL